MGRDPHLPIRLTSSRGALSSLAAIAGFASTILVFYPGTMSVDSAIQLREARARFFTDWHPPVMGWIWSFLDAIVAGPIGMLVLQSALFWAGLGLIVALSRVPTPLAPVVILAIGLFPPVFSTLGTIWKDVPMASALLLAFALLLYADRRSSRAALGAALVLLFLGVATRYNAILAAYPLALWSGTIAHRLASWGWVRRLRPLVLGHVLFAVLALSVWATNRILVDKRLYPTQQILVHDLTAVSVARDTVTIPESWVEYGGPMTVEKLDCLYSPDNAVDVFNESRGAECGLLLAKATSGAPVRALTGIWLEVIPRNLGPYAEHRWRTLRSTLALHRDRVCYPLATQRAAELAAGRMGFDLDRPPLYGPAMRVAAFTAYETPFFRPWIYLAAIVAMLGVALTVWRAGALPAIALGSSALLYGAGYLAVATTCAFRMTWWCLVVALVLPVVLWRTVVLWRNRGGGP